MSSVATGASLTAATVIVTVATFESSLPSLALYEKLSLPLKFADGVYVKLPFALSASVPWAGPVTSPAVNVPPSMSVSLPNTPGAATMSGWSSVAVYASGSATGESFTALIVIVTVATFESAVPSFAVYVKLSLPFVFAAGA